MTIKVRSNGKLIDVRNSTTHIGARKNLDPNSSDVKNTVHDRQMDQLIRFEEDDLRVGRPSIMGADLNAGDNAIIPRFGDIRMISPESKGATSLSGKTIDHLAYYSAGVLGKASIKVLRKPVTDHRIVIASWHLKNAEDGSLVSSDSDSLDKPSPISKLAQPADIRVAP